jgi:pimeloyl-ACP methyl ester carboxylesterase
MSQKKITLNNSKRAKLKGILHESDNKLEKILVFFHGLGSSKESQFYKTLYPLLEENKIPYFSFDFSAHGESEGKIESFTVSQGLDDANTVINFLKKKGYRSFVLIGSSFGGYVASYIAAKERLVTKLILRAPVLDYFKLMEERVKKIDIINFKKNKYAYYNSKSKLYWYFYNDIVTNKYSAQKGIFKVKCPIIVFHGTLDETVPFKFSKKICNQVANCQLIKIEKGDHRLITPEHQQKITEIIKNELIKEFVTL